MIFLLRLLQLLTMVIWVGGLLFFAFALAPTAFHVLPVHQAGLMVGSVLRIFHPVGLVCGAVFLAATAALFRRSPRIHATELLLTTVMMSLTFYLQASVLPQMERDQATAAGDIHTFAEDNPARLDFDRLHKQSEQLESIALLCGLAIVVLLARPRPTPIIVTP